MKLVCLGILLSFVMSFAQISVEVKDEQVYNPALLGLRTRVINNSGQSYDNVTINILLKKSASETYALDAYYTQGWNCSIAEQSGEYVVVRMVVPHVGTGTVPDENGVSIGIHRTDWQQLTKTSENGYPSGIAFTTAIDYSVYNGDVLIGGSSYIDPSSVVPSLRFVGLQPVDKQGENNQVLTPAWIEIENYGTTPANLNNFTLEWPSGTETGSSVISSSVLQPGKRVRICVVQQNCPDDDVVAFVPMLSMGAMGEVLLRYNGDAMDYLSWGLNEGRLASVARVANIQFTRIRHNEGFYDTYWHQVKSGIFYKKIAGQWYSYTPDYDVNTYNRPGPIPYVNNEMLCLESSDAKRKVRFAWRPVEGAKGYNLTVKKSDGTIIFSRFTHRVRRDIELGEGSYQWSVNVEFLDDKYVVNNPWMDHYAIWKTKTVEVCDNITDEHYLSVPQYGVHKDTRMLVPNWGELAAFPEISWDHPDAFVYNDSYNLNSEEPEESGAPTKNELYLEVGWRCWAAAIQMLNAFYHGNLTQDEIKYYGKTVGFENVNTPYGTHSREARDKIIAPFVLGVNGSGYPAEVIMTLKWALNLTDDSQLESGSFYGTLLDDNFVVNHINAGHPIYYVQDNHAMIIDGYRRSSGTFQIHRVNIHNGGEAGWTNNDRSEGVIPWEYYVPKNVTHPKMSDIRVHIDSDEDGIVDFDEDERFLTKKDDSDSDDDNIDDKVEILSYTLKEPFKLTMSDPTSDDGTGTKTLMLGEYEYDENTNVSHPYGPILRFERFANIDGDLLRAERDVDSDHANNDGLADGAEDLNHNGFVDNGEKDPYNFADDGEVVAEPVGDEETPESVAIYAFEGINVGDNVICNSGSQGYCRVASESALRYYALSIGANSTFGDVFSKGGVQLRNNAHVVGDVSIYSLPTSSISPDLSQGSSVSGATNVRNLGEWPYVVSDNVHHSLEGLSGGNDLTVQAGQSFTLNGDATYRNLKVDAGGTLKLGMGTIRVGNITMESGSKLEFTNPGRETVIIADGNIVWRTQIVNSDLQTVAKGFKLVEYAPGYIHIDGDWAGMIHARWSELTLGQVKKTAYGSFIAKKIYLGNGLTIYHVDFSPIPLSNLV